MRFVLLFMAVFATSPAVADNVASSSGLDGFVTVDRLPLPDQRLLTEGREIWADNCENCHGGNKLTGAPKITSTRAWAPRIDQGFDTLFDHAVNGFIGPKYTEMPARGGNLDLTDAEVKSAVLFMVWASGGRTAAEALAEILSN